ncbi:hypothetical protein L3Q82_014271, partial [Scortum barcoo]
MLDLMWLECVSSSCKTKALMLWTGPARSPDLNPIEHIWDIMSRSIHQRHVAPQTVQELADALVQAMFVSSSALAFSKKLTPLSVEEEGGEALGDCQQDDCWVACREGTSHGQPVSGDAAALPVVPGGDWREL